MLFGKNNKYLSFISHTVILFYFILFNHKLSYADNNNLAKVKQDLVITKSELQTLKKRLNDLLDNENSEEEDSSYIPDQSKIRNLSNTSSGNNSFENRDQRDRIKEYQLDGQGSSKARDEQVYDSKQDRDYGLDKNDHELELKDFQRENVGRSANNQSFSPNNSPNVNTSKQNASAREEELPIDNNLNQNLTELS